MLWSHSQKADENEEYFNSLPAEDQSAIIEIRSLLGKFVELLSNHTTDNYAELMKSWEIRRFGRIVPREIDSWIPGGVAVADVPAMVGCAHFMEVIDYEPLYSSEGFLETNPRKKNRKKKSPSILVVSPNALAYPDVAEAFEEIAKKLPMVYDSRLDSRGISIRKHDSGYYAPLTYAGRVPERIFLAGQKAYFMKCVGLIWSSNVITGKRENRLSKKLKGLGRAQTLANALLIGRTTIFLPTGQGTGGKLPSALEEMFENDAVRATEMTERMQKTYESVHAFADICRVWKYAAEEYSIAIRLDEDDLENAEKVAYQVKHLGDALGVEEYLDTYDMGVPIDDLLA